MRREHPRAGGSALQASPLGAPVHARMGFETPVHYLRFQKPER